MSFKKSTKTIAHVTRKNSPRRHHSWPNRNVESSTPSGTIAVQVFLGVIYDYPRKVKML